MVSRLFSGSPVIMCSLSAVGGAIAAFCLAAVFDVPAKDALHIIYTDTLGSDGSVLSTRLNPIGLLFIVLLVASAALGLLFLFGKFFPSILGNLVHRVMPYDMASSASLLIVGELQNVLGHVRRHGTSAERYDASLSAAQARLASLPATEQVRVVVSLLKDENERMRLDTADLKMRLFESNRKLQEVQGDLASAEQLAVTDSLTGLQNRRGFDIELTRLLSRPASSREPVSLILCDIDWFKQINDTHGHAVGDEVLKMVASVLRDSARRNADTVARVGGEEFGLIMPGLPLERAKIVAERLRSSLESQDLVIRGRGTKLGSITASFGVGLAGREDTGSSLVERVDATLYQAKQSGRNCVLTA